jgi:catechol 2,3-dioxygenase-like lactoylglutathione lyase family enzyme
MQQHIALTTMVVTDYDEAIDFYTKKLDFLLIEDIVMSATKRWVVVRPKGSAQGGLLLAKADGEEQQKCVGNQTGGRVGFFLYTDDFDRDYAIYQKNGVIFVRSAVTESYGKVAVFKDLYGNLWDLLMPF